MEREKRHAQRKENALQQRFAELERLRLTEQKAASNQFQHFRRLLTQQREESEAFKAKTADQQKEYADALRQRNDAIQRFAVCCQD